MDEDSYKLQKNL
jgi:hypothetical protein